MAHSQALLPQMIDQYGNTWTQNVLSVLGGVVLLSLLAQVSIPLPFTPVPITGQTFGVALVALLWGRSRALSVFVTYLMAGAAGAPIFALGSSGFALGPTMGYLVGMAASSFWIGTLADRGWTRSFARAWAATAMGSALVFAFGLTGLSFFVPKAQLLTAGFLPFIPGDLLKTALAASIASTVRAKRA